MSKGTLVSVKGCQGLWCVEKIWREAGVLRVIQGGETLLVRTEELKKAC